MGFNIKNNYGPNIEVNEGGNVTLYQDATGMWHTVEDVDAEVVDVEENEVQLVDLTFFSMKMFGTIESQETLREVLQKAMPKMDVDSGRDWVAVYIACHFMNNTLQLKKNYVGFFTDIERLFPNVLTKVKIDIPQGDKRYKMYTEALSSECTNWFIDKGCLPPMNEWTSTKYIYHVNRDRKKLIQDLVAEIYKNLKA